MRNSVFENQRSVNRSSLHQYRPHHNKNESMDQFDHHDGDSLDGSKFEHGANGPSGLGMITVTSPTVPKTAAVNYRPKAMGKTV